MVRMAKKIWETFEFNLNRARALALTQHYLKVMLEDGGEAIQTYIDKLLGGFSRIIGFDLGAFIQTVSETTAEPMRKEMERRIEELDTETLEKRFKGKEDELQEELAGILEPFLTLDLLSQQTLAESAIVMAVASYEAFLRDIVDAEARIRPSVINQFPEVQKLINFKMLRKYGGKPRVAQADLLSKSIETHSTGKVKSFFKRIYGIQNIFKSKKMERDIQQIIQIRHIVVHKGGIVDRDFKQATNTKQRLGERVSLPYERALDGIETIRSFGELVRNA